MRQKTLDAATATAFLARLGEHLDHNINIMDREGVIIASRDSSRVGTFHDAARHLVATGAEVERVYPIGPGGSLPAGVRPGVNLPIVHKGETVGVVGITGAPDDVSALAYAVKTSVESMLELEEWKDKAMRRQDSKHSLMNLLLYDDAPGAAVVSLARKLGYDSAVPRVPVIFSMPPGVEPADAIASFKRSGGHGAQDLSFSTSEGTVLVFKSLRFSGEGLLSSIEAEVADYVRSAGAALGGSARPSAWAGSFQTDFGRYRGAYRQAAWLAGRYPFPGEGPVFLHDHLLEYLACAVPRIEYVAALDAPLALFPPDLIRELGPSIQAFAESALNAKEAAARLGVHRNTFAARMDRVARVLGRDPRNDPVALDYLRLAIHYAGLKSV
jgi:carbohydrate diacid regulator